MRLDDILAKQIGALVVENAKLQLVIEAAKVEIAKRDKIIAEMTMRVEGLPLQDRTEAANGAAHW